MSARWSYDRARDARHACTPCVCILATTDPHCRDNCPIKTPQPSQGDPMPLTHTGELIITREKLARAEAALSRVAELI